MIHKLKLSQNAIQYAWRILMNCINGKVEATAGVCVKIAGIWLCYSNYENIKNATIIVSSCNEESWNRLITMPAHSLKVISTKEMLLNGKYSGVHKTLPVLFWGAGYEDGSKPFAEQLENGQVVFYADIIASTLFMLTRWEETVVKTRDSHDRFPASESVAYKQKFLDRPIIDEYAIILENWIKTIVSQWKPCKKKFLVKISHDVDSIRGATFGKLAGDIFKRRSFTGAYKTGVAFINRKVDPYIQGCYTLANLSEQHGLKSTFYFMAACKSRQDCGYSPLNSNIQDFIAFLRNRGHEVGFHPGYYSSDKKIFRKEKERMDLALGESSYGVRQHYLRFSVPDTWRLLEEYSLAYDSTLGYADSEGFRCGTCHPFLPFDLETDRVLNVLEVPLIVMDGTLRHYRQMAPDVGFNRILLLANRCKDVGGVFTLLWHNSSMQYGWQKWREMYESLLPKLSKMITR